MANKINRQTRVGKTKSERDAYARAIKNLNYETTLDESLSFPNSDLPDEELSAPISTERRPISAGEALEDHLRKNWLYWISSAVATLIAGGFVFFIFNFNRDMGKIEGRIEGFEKGLENNTSTIRENERKTEEALRFHQRELDKVHLEIEKLDFKLQEKRKK